MSSEESSSPNSNDQPKKRRGRPTIPPEQKKRIYWVKCVHCGKSFEWYHKMKDLKPSPVTKPDMTTTEKNRIYNRRYKEKQAKLKGIEEEIEKGKCLLDE